MGSTEGLRALIEEQEELEKHRPGCLFREASLCSVGVQCEHGYDVCPKCDPCTCEESEDGDG